MTLVRTGITMRICKKFRNFSTSALRCLGKNSLSEIHSDSTQENSNSMTFLDKVEHRRNEAKRSVIVQVQSEKSALDLYCYCSEYAKIKSMHHYCLSGQSHFILVEFESSENTKNLLNQCCHLKESHIMPTRTPFLWFRSKSARKKQTRNTDLEVLPLQHQFGTMSPTEKQVWELLQGARSLSDQICLLHTASHLNDLGERLRFLTARQIEQVLCGPFPHINVLPFGSSVNGFGRMGCDLDLVLQLDTEDSSEKCDDSRLVFQTKASSPDGRASSQRLMETVGDMCQLFLPGVSGVKRILQARVPIVKFQQDLTGVDCDLSVSNALAVKMSELLFFMGSHDTRVRPLVSAVRAWARFVGLTNPVPGRWVTNFSLVLLVLYFLQQRSPSILPTIDKLRIFSHAINMDKNASEDGISKDTVNKQNRENLAETIGMLFIEFLVFYSSFDFNKLAINLLTLSKTFKPEHTPLYIVNPLEPELNVSKNVSPEELEKLRIALRNAAWLLESAESGTLSPDKAVPWGLLNLFKENERPSRERSFVPPVSKRRRVSINKLFLEETR